MGSMTPPRARSPETPARGLTLGLLAFLGLALAGGLPGCGYTLSSVLPPHIKTIAIPTFANNSVEHGLADDITQALIDGFLADKKLRLERERDADSVLRG